MTNELLFAVGLFVIGFTLLFLMPESMKRNWVELEYKPPAADTVVLMLRFLGLLLIIFGVAVLAGAVEIFPAAGGPGGGDDENVRRWVD
ncbi:MAG: hypothetical protein ACNS63_12010 [Candidatus Nitrospinota bacterium M3_3B_026]